MCLLMKLSNRLALVVFLYLFILSISLTSLIYSLKTSVSFAKYKKLRAANEVSVTKDTLQKSDKKALTDLDEEMELDLKKFAPFFFWQRKNENTLELAKFKVDGTVDTFETVTKTEKKNLGYTKIVPSHDYTIIGAALEVLKAEKYSNFLVLFDTKTKNEDTFPLDLRNTSSDIVLYNDAWSTNDGYLYYLISSEDESSHNFWVINVKNKTNTKLLNGYNIRVVGWINDKTLAYYDTQSNKENKLVINSIDVETANVKRVGYCDNIWEARCRYSDQWFPDENKVYYFNVNESNAHVYNYAEQSNTLLFNILSNEEFARASSRGFSPHRSFLYLNLRQSYTDKQPFEAGLYEYYIANDSWRHISTSDYYTVLWPKFRDSMVLLKDPKAEKYYLHPTNTFDIHPVKVPSNIIEFVSI